MTEIFYGQTRETARRRAIELLDDERYTLDQFRDSLAWIEMFIE